MKYTTLPTKPGRYIDSRGDDWELTEDLEWYHYMNSRPSPRPAVEKWLPFTDAPNDDEPTPSEDKVQYIEDIKDIKEGDLVYFHDDPHGYRLIDAGCEDCLRVSLGGSDAPSWLRDIFHDVVLVRASFFDHATREVEEPEWPHPSDLELHVYLGADGAKYLYMPNGESDRFPWVRFPTFDNFRWWSADGLTRDHPEVLPLKELKLVQEEEESLHRNTYQPTKRFGTTIVVLTIRRADTTSM